MNTSPPCSISLCEAGVDPLEYRLVVDAGRLAPERDDAERGRRTCSSSSAELSIRVLRVEREVDAAVDRRSEGADAEVVERDPELERAAVRVSWSPRSEKFTSRSVASTSSRKSGAISKPRLQRTTPSRTSSAPHLDRLVEPLVRVERDRVGELESGERLRGPRSREAGERAVGAVDVQPDALLAAERRQLGEAGRPRRPRSCRRSRRRSAASGLPLRSAAIALAQRVEPHSRAAGRSG